MILRTRDRTPVRRLDIGGVVTDVTRTDPIDSAPMLQVVCSDPEWTIVRSPMFDLNADGKLDHIELHVGHVFWRLVQVQPSSSGVTLTFEDRSVARLRQYTSHLVRKRTDNYTRAMFIRDMIEEANKDGADIRFVCPRLHEKQAIEKGEQPQKRKKGAGNKGLGKHAKLTVFGQRASGEQRRIGEAILAVADQLNAPYRATLAMVEAALQESSMRDATDHRDSDGVMRGGVFTTGAGLSYTHKPDKAAFVFLTKGFWGKGGAIHLANTNSGLTSGQIAQQVEGSADLSGGSYDKHKAEAKRWVEAFKPGNAGGGDTVTIDEAYYFARGQAGSPESTWDAAVRLASEVGWALYCRANVVYFVEFGDLYTAKPSRLVDRDWHAISEFSYDWDQGKRISTLNLDVVASRWRGEDGGRIRQAEAVDVTGAGPADRRWVVQQVVWTRSSELANVTLQTISAAKKEPAPTQSLASPPANDPTALLGEGIDALLQACGKISAHSAGYDYGANHGRKLSKMSTHDKFDCSSSVSLALFLAKMFPGHSTAIVSGDFSSWGRPGKGRLFTVWYSPDHVWIQFHRGRWWRFDTSSHGSGPDGPRLRKGPRSTGGFTPRHWKGL